MEVEVLQVYESDKALIDSQIATAKHFPRNLTSCIENCVAMVSRSEELAKLCIYKVPRGQKQLRGISTHLAMLMAQEWGNMRIQSRIIDINTKHVTSEAIAFDLEKNLAVKKSIKRLIINSSGERFNEDMITVTSNAANSIAQRNAILAVIPRFASDEIFEAAKRTIAGDLSTEDKLKARRKIVIDGLKDRYVVTEKQVLFSIGKEAVAHIDADDIVDLVAIDAAIKQGDTTADFAFRGKQKEVVKPVEDRLVSSLKFCENMNQLEMFKPKLKTNEQRRVYEEMVQKFKEVK